MANNNTTLMEILKSELINIGKNEFKEPNQIVFFDDDFAFIKKIMRYDKDVQIIFNRIIFQNEKLESKEGDIHFKKMFLNKFLNRQISRQTVEDFSSRVLYTFLLYETYINYIYNDIEKFLLGTNETDSTGNNKRITDNRFLTSDLPRNNINLNVDDTVLNYGNTNSITRNKDINDNTNNVINKKYSLDELLKIETLLKNVFDEFDKYCFMQVF